MTEVIRRCRQRRSGDHVRAAPRRSPARSLMALRVDRVDYQPDSHLDTELADLCHQAIHGRTDQRPVTADLVASRLHTTNSQPRTSLVIARDEHHRLIGAIALRWPYVPTGTGRLWGPVVHPDHHGDRGHHLGDRLLTAICHSDGRAATLPAITTAEIPSAATGAHTLFTHAGWQRVPGRAAGPFLGSSACRPHGWRGRVPRSADRPIRGCQQPSGAACPCSTRLGEVDHGSGRYR